MKFSSILFPTAAYDSQDEQEKVYDIQIEVESSKDVFLRAD